MLFKNSKPIYVYVCMLNRIASRSSFSTDAKTPARAVTENSTKKDQEVRREARIGKEYEKLRLTWAFTETGAGGKL